MKISTYMIISAVSLSSVGAVIALLRAERCIGDAETAMLYAGTLGVALVLFLVAAWAIQQLERYPEWCECVDTAVERAIANRVINQRNVTLAERIDALIRQEGPAFVAVGALHMVGSDGLPTLLKARGFTVKQVF